MKWLGAPARVGFRIAPEVLRKSRGGVELGPVSAVSPMETVARSGMLVCVFITAVPLIKLFAWGECVLK